MGEHEEWPHLSGLLLNGLLPTDSASVIRVLDGERWAEAEKRTAELIACIQPNQLSEDRRGAVADYVQRLIMQCFPCQVVTFGSVPLKTYLPDGDIDVTAFSKNQNLKDTWAVQVRDILESEEKNENAEFRVKEVQYIQAEVKIIKCLVENIVVDISFNQLGGLCTLCFLEEVDNLINQDHLFKRSIILIKAWCYYESRILGAHHGLISTYALETLVLYIFHIYNNSFTGPLEVLYRFLEFFRNFDWENFCVSLWGPVPVSSLPDINVEPPRKDGGELLLSKVFLQACNSVYAVFPGGLENQGQPFISKHLNVVDPLRINNNLGRSVSKGNFYRIRSAFAFGAKRLARLLDCPKENIAFELNQFFMNTWERHGSGIRPDAPVSDLACLRLSNTDHGSNNQLNSSYTKESNDDASMRVIEVEAVQSIQPLSSQHVSHPQESTEKVNSKLSIQSDRSQRTLKNDQISNQLQGKHLFARTRSSPELTDAYRVASSRSRRIKPAENGKGQVASNSHISSNDPSSVSQISSHHMLNVPVNTSTSNSHIDDFGTSTVSEDHASVIGAQGMLQEEQDLVNMMASASLHNFGGHIPMPLNLASAHLPLQISQSVLASMGYGQRSVAGMLPPNIPRVDPHWTTDLQFQQELMSYHLSHLSRYVPVVEPSTNSEDVIENLGAKREYWHEQHMASNGGFGLDDTTLEVLHGNDMQPSTSQAGSGRSKTSSESYWDGSSARISKVACEKRGRKVVASTAVPSKNQVKGKNIHERASSDVDDGYRDFSTLPTMENKIGESITPSQTAPMVLGPGSRQRGTDNSGDGRFTFYPTGPPVPFFTMLPIYNYPAGADTSEPSRSSLGEVDGTDNSDSGQTVESTELHAPDVLNAYNHMRTSTNEELSEEPKRDILNSDFASHWQNLQFGRLCQGPRYPAPVALPGPPIPPMYLQGRVPWDGPGRPLSANPNLAPMSYGPHLVPVPLQSDSSRPTTVYQRYADELPRYRSGTGTYLPNPRVSVRDQYSSGARRNSYNYDRSDQTDREENWNTAKSRAAGRNHNRRQADKSRVDRLTANGNWADRPWGTHRHQPQPYQAQNGPLRPGSSNVAYGMYPLPGMNPAGVAPNGPTMQPFVMLYPYDHNSGYVSLGDQPEFGSLGPVGYMGSTDSSQPADAIQSSPDQPSSPHFHRRI